MEPDTTAAPPPTSHASPAKPGYLTSEFWLKLASMALSALFASGVLTSDRELAIAGMAASVLGALGYTVSRTLVKRSTPPFLVMVLVMLVAAHASACSSPAVKTAGRIAWDCTAGERKQAVDILVPLATNAVLNGVSADGQHVDLAPLKAATSKASLFTDLGVTLWCAASEAIAVITNPPASPDGSPQSAPMQVDPAALRRAWQEIKPDAAFITGVHDASGNQVVM